MAFSGMKSRVTVSPIKEGVKAGVMRHEDPEIRGTWARVKGVDF